MSIKAFLTELLLNAGKATEAKTLIGESLDQIDALGDTIRQSQVHRILGHIILEENALKW